MDTLEARYRLEFDDNRSINDQVGLIHPNLLTFVPNLDLLLLLDNVAIATKLQSQRVFADFLEETHAQLVGNAIRRANHGRSYRCISLQSNIRCDFY